jgi:hypothetical protein
MQMERPLPPLAQHLQQVAAPLRAYVDQATEATRRMLGTGGRIDPALAHRHQRELHGLAWITTTAEAVLAAAQWGLRLAGANRLAEAESLVLRIAVGEYLAQLAGGIAMSQSEIFRPAELGLAGAVAQLQSDASSPGSWPTATPRPTGRRCWRPSARAPASTTRWSIPTWTWCASSSGASPTSASRRGPTSGTWTTC